MATRKYIIMNPNSKKYKNQENKLKTLSALHNLIMIMMTYIKSKDINILPQLESKMTEEIASVMNKITKVFFDDDENITIEEVIEVLDSEWNRLNVPYIKPSVQSMDAKYFNKALNSKIDETKIKEIDDEIQRMMRES